MALSLGLVAGGFTALTTWAAHPAAAATCSQCDVNVVVNPGAEDPALGVTTVGPVIAPNGWNVTGNLTEVQYGVPGISVPADSAHGSYDLTTGVFNGGNNIFGGGNGPLATATQTIAFNPDTIAMVSSGTGTYDLSAFLGGLAGQNDNATVTVVFQDAAANNLLSQTIGPVLNADRGGVDATILRESAGVIPATATQATVTLTLTRTDGTYNNGYADNIQLLLHAAAPFTCATSAVLESTGDPTQLNTLQPSGTGFTPSPIGAPVLFSPTKAFDYNAIGFYNNFVYGIRNNNQVVRVDSTGSTTDLGTTTPALGGADVGAIDASGKYYVTTTGSSTLSTIDLTNPSLPVTTTPMSAPWAASDWTLINGQLWGKVTGTGAFERLDPGSGTVTTFLSSAVPATVAAGAAWTYGNGNLGLADENGGVYQVEIDNSTTANPIFSLIAASAGPTATLTDATNCVSPDPIDLGVTSTETPSPAGLGQPVSWTLTVTNQSTGTSSGSVVQDTVPASVIAPSTTTPGCSFGSGADDHLLTCVLGALTGGQTTNISFTGTTADVPGTLTNSARVIGNEADPNPGNDIATITSAVTGPDVSVALAGPQGVHPGRHLPWTITVQNNGPGDAPNVVLQDVVPAGVIHVNLQSPVPGCAVTGQTLNCTFASIPQGGTVVISLRGTPTDAAEPLVTDTVTVTSANDPDPSNNTANLSTRVTPDRPVPLDQPPHEHSSGGDGDCRPGRGDDHGHSDDHKGC